MSGQLQAVVVRTADALAREHTEEAIATLHGVMTNEFAKDSDRIKAAGDILDRGHGKPLAATIQLPVSTRLAEQLHALSNEELLRIATNNAAIDAEFDFDAACAALPQSTDPLLL